MDPAHKVTKNTSIFGNLQTVVTEHLYFTSCLALSEVAGKSWQKLRHLEGALGMCGFSPSTSPAALTSAAEQNEGKQSSVCTSYPFRNPVEFELKLAALSLEH